MYEELRQWRSEHPEASYDEIARAVTPKRRSLMGQLLEDLAYQHGDREEIEGVKCAECGEYMIYKGKPKRGIEHRAGEAKLKRAYYYCAQCKTGLFPLDEQLQLGEHTWSPETVKQIVKLGVEIPSYRRAAVNYSELTQVGVSKSKVAD